PQEEDEDVSEEQGGTEFFVDDKPSKNKQNDAEPNEVHAEIEKVAVKSSEVKTSTEHENEEEDEEEDEDNAENATEDEEKTKETANMSTKRNQMRRTTKTPTTADLSFTERIVKDKGMLARWVFGITIAVCLVFILCVCTFRRRCCRQKDNSKTLAGHRYSSVNNQPLVIPPEKERLHQ
ncbi:hypothetical protein OSTOST_03618, partial [Ostertagia ostertagi]